LKAQKSIHAVAMAKLLAAETYVKAANVGMQERVVASATTWIRLRHGS
jgi:hypothetical protein